MLGDCPLHVRSSQSGMCMVLLWPAHMPVEHTLAHVPVDMAVPVIHARSHREMASHPARLSAHFKLLSTVRSKGPPHTSQQTAQRRVWLHLKIQFACISCEGSLLEAWKSLLAGRVPLRLKRCVYVWIT